MSEDVRRIDPPFSPEYMTKLYTAAAYSAEKHVTQERGGSPKRPYFTHTFRVANIVFNYGFTDIDAQVAAMCHDVVEDQFPNTDAGIVKGLEDIRRRFGDRVAQLVGWLTLPVDCRKDRDKKVDHQMKVMAEMDDIGCAIKIADKMSNVGDMIDDPPNWGRNAKLGYSSDSKKVVLAAAVRPRGQAVHQMISDFDIIFKKVKAAL